MPHAVVSSSLVKAAVHGRDPNWGRIAGAAGNARLADGPVLVAGGLAPELASARAGELAVLDEEQAVARHAGDRTLDRVHDVGVVEPGHQHAALGDLLEIPGERGEPAFFLVLDQVQDPRNLGAVLRTAEATGAHGVIVPKHHAAGLTGAAAKSAMGAAELIPVARETNLVNALETLKKESIWMVGAVPAGGKLPWELEMTGPICLVLGGEGEGLRPLVAKSCDFLVSLPMRGRLESLNVSAAAAVLCYEVVRQRRGNKGLDRKSLT